MILAITIITSTFVVSHSMEIQIGDEVEKYGPNIVITPKAQLINIPYGGIVVGDVVIPENYVEKIYTIPNRQNIRVISPKVYGQVQYRGNNLLLVGIIPESEIQLKRWWNITGSLPRGEFEIILGSTIKSTLGLTLGSIAQINNISLTVVGFLSETGSIDDYSVFLPLHTAQMLLNLTNKVHVIEVGALCKDCPVEVIAQQIMEVMPNVKATPIKQAVELRAKIVKQTVNFSLLLAFTILITGCIGIMNTMLASIHERIREIGVLISLGADSSHLYKIFFLESVILGLISGFVGIVTGLISSMSLGPLIMGATINLEDVPIYIVPLTITLSISSCLIASFYPAWRASKIDPVKALKTV
ncbi:ABC transporter permease [Candidatus Bathyarchaeota archaeon]|nr:ABC transporter permease [Candidatus Bathyarchaeota archaeon]MBS7618223.1 ABC transporter permease [Candidatus Bathyarchaeota archaeon]